MTSTYIGYRLYANNITTSLQRVAAEPANAQAEAYYQANIGKVTSIDQFLGNYRLFSYAMQAYGLSDLGNATGFMKKVLESDLTDSHSFANSLSDSRYRAFAAAFQFSSTGTLTNTTQIQTSVQKLGATTRFASASTESATAQASDTAYFTAQIGTVTSVGALESNSRLLSYVRTAYGLDSSVSNDTITKALESDLSDSNSFANTTSNTGLKSLALDFNFAADGSVSSPAVVQSSSDITKTVAAYTAAAGTDTASQAAATAETSYYKAHVVAVTSVDSLLGDSRLTAYMVKAYGLPATTSASTLKSILTSDLTDPKSVANKMGGGARSLAAAFNVTTTGTIAHTPVIQAQSRSAVIATEDAYLETSMETEAGTNQGEGVRLALYFRSKASTITSAYSILADKALTQVTQTMLGLSASSSNADIDAQARTITQRLNLADLKNPAKLDNLMARFSALYDIANGNTDNSWVSQLF